MIHLENIKLTDSKKIFDLIEKNRTYLSRYLPWVEDTKDCSVTIDFVKYVNKLYALNSGLFCGIYYQRNFCGVIGCINTVSGDTTNINYWISEEYSGKGICTLAVKNFIKKITTIFPIKTIIIAVDEKNIRSAKVAMNCGFHIGKKLLVDGNNQLEFIKNEL